MANVKADYFVCERVAALKEPAPDSVAGEYSECGERVWQSPACRALAGKAKVVCSPCFLEIVGG